MLVVIFVVVTFDIVVGVVGVVVVVGCRNITLMFGQNRVIKS